jgi:hypothetical protein
MLLSQGTLNMAGCTVMRPATWARLAGGVERDQVGKWLHELEDAGLVSIDEATEELVIRTFVRHDNLLRNQNTGRGMWSGWASIESPMLRQVVVDNLPDEAWEVRFQAPIDARRMRGEGPC